MTGYVSTRFVLTINYFHSNSMFHQRMISMRVLLLLLLVRGIQGFRWCSTGSVRVAAVRLSEGELTEATSTGPLAHTLRL